MYTYIHSYKRNTRKQKKTRSTRIPGVVSLRNSTKLTKLFQTTEITKFEWIHGDLHNVKTEIYYSLFVIVFFFGRCAHIKVRKVQRVQERARDREKGHTHLSFRQIELNNQMCRLSYDTDPSPLNTFPWTTRHGLLSKPLNPAHAHEHIHIIMNDNRVTIYITNRLNPT